MNTVKWIESLLILLICTGCKSGVEKDIASMMGQEFICNNTIENNESDIPSIPNQDDRYSLIVYYDSLECMACHANRLNSWNKFIKICNDHNVGIFFIFSPKENDIMNLRMNLIRQRFKHPVFIDSCGIIRRDNSWISDNRMCHTFLLNDENKVIMIGDPRKSQSLMNLFMSTVK